MQKIKYLIANLFILLFIVQGCTTTIHPLSNITTPTIKDYQEISQMKAYVYLYNDKNVWFIKRFKIKSIDSDTLIVYALKVNVEEKRGKITRNENLNSLKVKNDRFDIHTNYLHTVNDSVIFIPKKNIISIYKVSGDVINVPFIEILEIASLSFFLIVPLIGYFH